jgi:hypothetical protein
MVAPEMTPPCRERSGREHARLLPPHLGHEQLRVCVRRASVLECGGSAPLWIPKKVGPDRLSRSVWSARSLLPLLSGDANPSTSKAPASRTHSKRFAIKAGHFESLPSHFSPKDECAALLWIPKATHPESVTKLAHSKTFGQAQGPGESS